MPPLFPNRLLPLLLTFTLSILLTPHSSSHAHPIPPEIQSILQQYCFDCHGDGMKKGKVSLDPATDPNLTQNKPLWLNAYKNLESGMMPPPQKPQPSPELKSKVLSWLRNDVFNINPTDPDPGKVTLRRLNRAEYRNTIKDLMGIDFDTDQEFPADDTGHGFDNIGDVLTLSPMLLEKYLAAARKIVEDAVPASSRVIAEHRIQGNRFLSVSNTASALPSADAKATSKGKNPPSLSYYYTNSAESTHLVTNGGHYEIEFHVTANEKFVDGQFDLNRCVAHFECDGQEVAKQEFTRQGGKLFKIKTQRELTAGSHQFAVRVLPILPLEKQVRNLSLRVDAVVLKGPTAEVFWVTPLHYEKFFGKPLPATSSPNDKRNKAKEVLQRFVSMAYRRPAEEQTVTALVDLALKTATAPDSNFERGIHQAMVAVLASPRFLFREEFTQPLRAESKYPLLDEYSLASRLSYFLWSTMPDQELRKLAEQGRLRKDLKPQVHRMMRDSKFQAFISQFVGQWLQSRDIESVVIDHRAVMGRELQPDPAVEKARKRFRELRERDQATLSKEEKEDFAKSRDIFFKSFGRFNPYELTGDLRRAMKQETEKYVDYVIRENRSLLELIDSDYTFLNQKLAEFYGIEGVKGDEVRRVTVAPSSGRGGILTHGTVLVTTSNPTRTSPVKRGLFILDNILGTPTPPPPANVPPLEDAAKKSSGKTLSLRETLAIHRENALCSSCHNRMDPLGLALEHFNALGRWRDQDQSQPIEAAGTLITGEPFQTIQELKKILREKRKTDFYRCLSEKLMIFALGRGLDERDLVTIENLVTTLENSNGNAGELIQKVIESSAFQRTQITQATAPDRRASTSPYKPSASELARSTP